MNPAFECEQEIGKLLKKMDYGIAHAVRVWERCGGIDPEERVGKIKQELDIVYSVFMSIADVIKKMDTDKTNERMN